MLGGGSGLEIKGCCFTGKQTEELCPTGLRVLECAFQREPCSLSEIKSIRGFDPDATPRSGEMFDRSKGGGGQQRRLLRIAASAMGISIVVASVIAWVYHRIAMQCPGAVKIPAALK
jgi:hypothetical protein